MTPTFAPETPNSIPLYAVAKSDLSEWVSTLVPAHQAWVETNGYTAAAGTVLSFASPTGGVEFAVVGMGEPRDHQRKRFLFSKARAALPAGVYRLETELSHGVLQEAALGWLLAGYRFDRYTSVAHPKAMLIAPAGIDKKLLEAMAAGECLTRDLINTPTADMGPQELQDAALALAQQFDATANVTIGDELLTSNFPMIHAVGRASVSAPRLIDFRWGSSGPRLTLVGKGVCFDTGGLNIKPGASMGLMKKDMGGAATVLGLAKMIMTLGLPIQLRVLIPAVENSISGSAFRPQDILTARNGLTVEINNTDAEGRLVLADALALADEENPDLILSMATLTGAARVAVGPDLAPFYSTDSDAADKIRAAAQNVSDPVWQMPFWDPYEAMIEPGIADLDNAPKGGFAGSITAALFLRRFVRETPRYLHFDIYGWQPVAEPARPKGGAGQGARAILNALPDLLGF